MLRTDKYLITQSGWTNYYTIVRASSADEALHRLDNAAQNREHIRIVTAVDDGCYVDPDVLPVHGADSSAAFICRIHGLFYLQEQDEKTQGMIAEGEFECPLCGKPALLEINPEHGALTDPEDDCA